MSKQFSHVLAYVILPRQLLIYNDLRNQATMTLSPAQGQPKFNGRETVVRRNFLPNFIKKIFKISTRIVRELIAENIQGATLYDFHLSRQVTITLTTPCLRNPTAATPDLKRLT